MRGRVYFDEVVNAIKQLNSGMLLGSFSSCTSERDLVFRDPEGPLQDK